MHVPGNCGRDGVRCGIDVFKCAVFHAIPGFERNDPPVLTAEKQYLRRAVKELGVRLDFGTANAANQEGQTDPAKCRSQKGTV
jgi:hypothetical protein